MNAWHAYNVALDAALVWVWLHWPAVVFAFLAWSCVYILRTLGRGTR